MVAGNYVPRLAQAVKDLFRKAKLRVGAELGYIPRYYYKGNAVDGIDVGNSTAQIIIGTIASDVGISDKCETEPPFLSADRRGIQPQAEKQWEAEP